MREAFTDWKPHGATKERVEQAIAIIAEYQTQGLRLTLRQLYYQFVARDLLPNVPQSYKNLGNVIGRARMAGLIDWNAIEDRNREPDVPTEFKDLDALVDAALRSYKLPRWAGQQSYCELWVEKAALAGVLQPIASKYHVTLMVNRGYSSLSAMYESAQRIIENADGGKYATIFYLGDHDPSGEDMVRDIQDRLDVFTYNMDIEVNKIALTMEQIEQYDPPPNPTKLSDSRAQAYIAKYGHESWEVDALDPTTLQDLISEAIEGVLDAPLMDEVIEREESDRGRLRRALKNLRKKG